MASKSKKSMTEVLDELDIRVSDALYDHKTELEKLQEEALDALDKARDAVRNFEDELLGESDNW